MIKKVKNNVVYEFTKNITLIMEKKTIRKRRLIIMTIMMFQHMEILHVIINLEMINKIIIIKMDFQIIIMIHKKPFQRKNIMQFLIDLK